MTTSWGASGFGWQRRKESDDLSRWSMDRPAAQTVTKKHFGPLELQEAMEPVAL
jgi:hypothetical protein